MNDKFIICDRNEAFLLTVAKPNLDIVENTCSKPQETLESKMTEQKNSFTMFLWT